MKNKRKLTRREVAGMLYNEALRMSPHELAARLGVDRPLSQSVPLDFELELDMDEMLDPDECPAFDDMEDDE